jgi:hypothetical protein
MSMRTTETTVTFRHPFALAGLDGRQPAGTYRLVTEEEQIPGLSFVAYRRLATMLHLPADPAPGDTRPSYTSPRYMSPRYMSQVISVDPVELAALLAADAS